MLNSEKILKSPNDHLNYEHLKLNNNLNIILIQDKKATKSNVVMSVKVGSFQDPKESNGLAHFLEHMLFMGSKKYPQTDAYRNFISNNGGSTNAWTDLNTTVFYHSVNKEKFVESLDIFAQFFIEPLILKKYVEKEINIVDSEFKKNFNNDGRKELQICRFLAREDTVYHKFGTGNLNTLKKNSIFDELKNFHSEHYSANLMNLVIYHFDEIENYKNEIISIFQKIPNKNKNSIDFTKIPFPYRKENLSKLLKFKSTKIEKRLKLKWYLDPQNIHYKNPPLSILTFLIGHESEGSLHSLLNYKNLINGLIAGKSTYKNYFSIFYIDMQLTPKGFKNIDQIIQIIGLYLEKLRKEGIPKRIFEEIKKTKKLNFDFQIKSRGLHKCKNIARNVGNYPISLCNKVFFLMENYTPELYMKLLDKIKSDNLQIILNSHDFEDLKNVESIYKTPYEYIKLNIKIKKYIDEPDIKNKFYKDVYLPPVNYLIPEKFKILEGKKKMDYPVDLLKNFGNKLFYKLDQNFKLPHVSISYYIFTEKESFETSPKIFLFREMWKKILMMNLKKFNYLANTAKMYFSVYNIYKGLKFNFQGFSDKIDLFILTIGKKIENFMNNVTKKYLKVQFKKIKLKKLDEYDKSQKLSPYKQLMSNRGALLMTNTYSKKTYHDELVNLKFEDFYNYYENFLTSFYYESLYIGNISKKQSLDMNEKFINILKKKKNFKFLSKNEIVQNRPIKLNKRQKLAFQKEIINKKDKNNCVQITFQYKQDYQNQYLLQILKNYLKPLFFHEIRTEKEMGYIVFTTLYSIKGAYGIEFLIQSSEKNPNECINHIYKFLDNHIQIIINITDKKFEDLKKSIIFTLTQEYNNIYEEAHFYLSQISTGRYCFDNKKKSLEFVKNLKKQDLIDLYLEIFFKNRKVLETFFLKENCERDSLGFNKLFKGENIKCFFDEEYFKKQMELYPDISLK